MATDRRITSFSPKELLVERWARRRLGRIEHERRVAAIASTLFDLTRHLHGLASSERRLLRLACLLHDVGRSVDRKSHPAVGARMIERDTVLPLSTAERRAICYLTRYHRGAVPAAGFDDLLEASDDRKTLRHLLALLRSADSLDSRSALIPRIVIALKGRKIAVTCYLEDDCAKTRRIYRRRKKHRLLEELLKLRVEVTIELAEAVHAVA